MIKQWFENASIQLKCYKIIIATIYQLVVSLHSNSIIHFTVTSTLLVQLFIYLLECLCSLIIFWMKLTTEETGWLASYSANTIHEKPYPFNGRCTIPKQLHNKNNHFEKSQQPFSRTYILSVSVTVSPKWSKLGKFHLKYRANLHTLV